MCIDLSALKYDLDRLQAEGFTAAEAVEILFRSRPWLFDGVIL
jgi:hypothetical protein